MTPETKAQRKTRKQREAAERLEADNDLREVMSTPAGRRFIWALTDDDSVSFDGENTHISAYREGARNLRVELKARVRAVTREKFVAMVSEAMARFPIEPIIDEPDSDEEE